MDVTLPGGHIMRGVPEGTTKAQIKAVALKNNLATEHDFTVAEHVAPYTADIRQAEQENGLPPGLLSAQISKESSGRPDAVSKAGAIGLTQVLPTTLADMGYDEQEVANNPQLQIQAGAKYLAQMLKATGGDVGRALTAYHSGLGNLAKYESGEKEMGPETRAYATDPRFARFLQQPQQQAPQSELDQRLQSTQQDVPEPAPAVPFSEQAADAGRGLLQAGVNIANIPAEVGDAAVSAGAWAAGKAGLSDGTYTPALRAQLPENLRPQSQEAQLGADILPYLIPAPGAREERLAATVEQGIDKLLPRVANYIERNVPASVAENTVGALAQNSGTGQDNFAQDLALGTGASVAVRGVLPFVSRAATATREAINARRAATEATPAPAADATPAPAAGAAPEPAPAGAADVNPPQNGAGAAPEPVPDAVPGAPAPAPAPAAAAAAPEEDALRTLANRTRDPNDPNLASSLDGLNIQPRADVQQAADRLGVGEDLLPSHLSGNAQYQAVEQAIKSRKGSGLKVQEDEAILKLAQRAGKLTEEAAGADSSAAVSERFRREVDQRMNALEARSNQLYKRVENAMPRATPVDSPNTAALLEREADDLGGWEYLKGPEKKIFQGITPDGDPNKASVLTYGRLNKLRQDLGSAIYKNEGVYKDANKGFLKRVYGALGEDQRAALGDVGARRDFEVANRLVQMRKTLEDSTVKLMGKDLTGDATRQSQLAVQQLAKGNPAKFRQLFEPTARPGGKTAPAVVSFRAHRQQLIADAVGEQLSAGRRGSDFNPAGFADWYGNLQKNGGLQLIAKHMPGDFMRQLRDVYTVANAIRRAKAHEVTTGALNDFTKRYDRVAKSAQLISDHGTKLGASIGGFAGGGIGAGVGAAAGAKISQKAAQLGGAASSEASERLLTSPAYQNAVRKMARADADQGEKVVQEAENVIKKTPQYRAFIQSLPQSERVRIGRLGLFAWANDDSENN